MQQGEGSSLKDGINAAKSCQACQSHLSTRLGFVCGFIMSSQLSTILSLVLWATLGVDPPGEQFDSQLPASQKPVSLYC